MTHSGKTDNYFTGTSEAGNSAVRPGEFSVPVFQKIKQKLLCIGPAFAHLRLFQEEILINPDLPLIIKFGELVFRSPCLVPWLKVRIGFTKCKLIDAFPRQFLCLPVQQPKSTGQKVAIPSQRAIILSSVHTSFESSQKSQAPFHS